MIEKTKTFENYNKVWNTISASIPIALKDASTKQQILSNNNVIIAGYGVGLSWGSALIKWNKILWLNRKKKYLYLMLRQVF